MRGRAQSKIREPLEVLICAHALATTTTTTGLVSFLARSLRLVLRTLLVLSPLPVYDRRDTRLRMKLTLRPEWRLRPLSSFLGCLDIKTGVVISILFAVGHLP